MSGYGFTPKLIRIRDHLKSNTAIVNDPPALSAVSPPPVENNNKMNKTVERIEEKVEAQRFDQSVACRVYMGQKSSKQIIAGSGPYKAMSYLGVARTYAAKVLGSTYRNLTFAQVWNLFSDPHIYGDPADAGNGGNLAYVIRHALIVLGVAGVDTLLITSKILKNDPAAVGVMRQIGTVLNPDEAGHWQEWSFSGTCRWHPVDKEKNTERNAFSIWNIYIRSVP